MNNSSNIKKWDIVLINMLNNKKRPALVISPERHNTKNDIIVLFITSNLNTPEEFGSFKIVNWEKAKLPKPAIIKMNFSTVNKKHMKSIGRLTVDDISNFEKNFSDFFNISK